MHFQAPERSRNGDMRANMGTKKGDIRGQVRIIHNEDRSPAVIRIVKSIKIRLTERMARMGEILILYGLSVEKPFEKRALG
jgi:hypothetical protein